MLGPIRNMGNAVEIRVDADHRCKVAEMLIGDLGKISGKVLDNIWPAALKDAPGLCSMHGDVGGKNGDLQLLQGLQWVGELCLARAKIREAVPIGRHGLVPFWVVLLQP